MRIITIVALAVSISTVADAASLKPSPALRAACGADARKFCSRVLYNAGKRQACMRAHYMQLSPRCTGAIKVAQQAQRKKH